jgi:hypothetical protein
VEKGGTDTFSAAAKAIEAHDAHYRQAITASDQFAEQSRIKCRYPVAQSVDAIACDGALGGTMRGSPAINAHLLSATSPRHRHVTNRRRRKAAFALCTPDGRLAGRMAACRSVGFPLAVKRRYARRLAM